jgi:hypothetical protein
MMNCLMTEQLFYAVLLVVPCFLGVSVSSACAHDQRLILTDHARKARWIARRSDRSTFRLRTRSWWRCGSPNLRVSAVTAIISGFAVPGMRRTEGDGSQLYVSKAGHDRAAGFKDKFYDGNGRSRLWRWLLQISRPDWPPQADYHCTAQFSHEANAMAQSPCPTCAGSGKCPGCNGAGLLADENPPAAQQSGVVRTCPGCGGSGKCPTCKGSGLTGPSSSET